MTSPRRIAHSLAALAAFGLSSASLATPDAKAQAEIDGLLAFVASSPCRFVRGGTEYEGREARDHLARKLDVARPMLSTADQFIDYVATGSSVTGEAYKVRCGTRETTSKAWLADELARLRRAGKAQ